MTGPSWTKRQQQKAKPLDKLVPPTAPQPSRQTLSPSDRGPPPRLSPPLTHFAPPSPLPHTLILELRSRLPCTDPKSGQNGRKMDFGPTEERGEIGRKMGQKWPFSHFSAILPPFFRWGQNPSAIFSRFGPEARFGVCTKQSGLQFSKDPPFSLMSPPSPFLGCFSYGEKGKAIAIRSPQRQTLCTAVLRVVC